MATNAQNSALNNEVVNNQNSNNGTEDAKQTRRVWETRNDWDVVFYHVVDLAVLALKGEALPAKPQNGFAFGKVTDKHGKKVDGKVKDLQPNIKGYALGVIAGLGTFSAKKFAKAFSLEGEHAEKIKSEAFNGNSELHQAAIKAAQTYGLDNLGNRLAIASQLVTACGFCSLDKAVETISKADAKQGRAVCLAIAKQLAETAVQPKAETQAEPTEVQPTAETPKAKKASPKGKKAAKKAAKAQAA